MQRTLPTGNTGDGRCWIGRGHKSKDSEGQILPRAPPREVGEWIYLTYCCLFLVYLSSLLGYLYLPHREGLGWVLFPQSCYWDVQLFAVLGNGTPCYGIAPFLEQACECIVGEWCLLVLGIYDLLQSSLYVAH